MMIHAYQEIYVNNAQTMLGDAFDYAINTCHISGDDFVKMFVVSSFSERIENGEPACVAGKSGIELVHEIVFETMQKELNIESEVNYSRSCEYWIGWAVAYYQWYSDRSFKEIFRVLSFECGNKLKAYSNYLWLYSTRIIESFWCKSSFDSVV